MALIDRVAKEDSKSDDKYIQKVKMNAYPDRVRAFLFTARCRKNITSYYLHIRRFMI